MAGLLSKAGVIHTGEIFMFISTARIWRTFEQNEEGPRIVDVFFAVIGAVVASPDLALIMWLDMRLHDAT